MDFSPMQFVPFHNSLLQNLIYYCSVWRPILHIVDQLALLIVPDSGTSSPSWSLSSSSSGLRMIIICIGVLNVVSRYVWNCYHISIVFNSTLLLFIVASCCLVWFTRLVIVVLKMATTFRLFWRSIFTLKLNVLIVSSSAFYLGSFSGCLWSKLWNPSSASSWWLCSSVFCLKKWRMAD